MDPRIRIRIRIRTKISLIRNTDLSSAYKKGYGISGLGTVRIWIQLI